MEDGEVAHLLGDLVRDDGQAHEDAESDGSGKDKDHACPSRPRRQVLMGNRGPVGSQGRRDAKALKPSTISHSGDRASTPRSTRGDEAGASSVPDGKSRDGGDWLKGRRAQPLRCGGKHA
jgi:hypothetical protein